MSRKTENYSSLLNNHIKTILESGLLLDEDYEVLLNSTTFTLMPPEPPPPKLLIYGAAIGTSVLLWKVYRPLILMPAVGVAVYFWKQKRRKLEREIVGKVVEEFVKLRRFNVAVMRYLKVRATMEESSEVTHFMTLYLNVWKEFLEFLMRELEGLVLVNQLLSEDFEVLKHLQLDLTSTTTVQDLVTFMFSKYLNYVGLTFNKLLQHPSNHLQVLLNTKLPLIRERSTKLHNLLHKEFNNAKYSGTKKLQIEPRKKVVSGKLQETLDGAVNNLSVILEKSRGILERMDTADEGKVEQLLRDLRSHAQATYESLDVLCRLYGILNQSRQPQLVPIQPPVKATSCKTISYNDNPEVVEENYELYIAESPHASPPPTPALQDTSGQYLSLMLQELHQSLSKHERFIEAKNKRGGTEPPVIKVATKTVPKFDLNPPKPPPRPSKQQGPPPPPPLPPLSVEDHAESSDKGLLEGIRMLSSQLQGEEDIFM